MKSMIALIALCAIQTSYAQKVISKSYSSDQIQKIKINTEYADIELESYDGSEILIEASVNINMNLDNDSYSFKTEKNNNVFAIQSKMDFNDIPRRVILKDYEGNTKILLEEDASLENIKDTDHNYKSINYGYQTDITLKIRVPENKDLIVESIYGDLIATGNYDNIDVNITYGDVEIKTFEVNTSSTINLTSTYGHVDYSVPQSSDIEFNLSTSYGEIFSDLNVISTKSNVFENNTCGGERGGKYMLNEGKSIAYITATYGDVYLRGN